MELEAPFIFESYWRFLKMFQIIGCFPCAKSTNEEGKITLRPLNSILVVFLYSFTWFVIICSIIVTFLMMPELDSSVVTSRIIGTWSIIDRVVRTALFFTLVFLHVFLLISSLKIRRKLCLLQDFINSNFHLTTKDRYVNVTKQ